MLSGVELHLPLHTVAPASSTTQIDVCSRDTSSPTYCCCGFMLVLRFKVAEARRYQPPLPRLPDVPTCLLAERRAQRQSIGIGGLSRCRPSHTTGHTGPYHGGSAD